MVWLAEQSLVAGWTSGRKEFSVVDRVFDEASRRLSSLPRLRQPHAVETQLSKGLWRSRVGGGLCVSTLSAQFTSCGWKNCSCRYASSQVVHSLLCVVIVFKAVVLQKCISNPGLSRETKVDIK
nr:hypothetical protein CFP56_04520 [Quercus suber]